MTLEYSLKILSKNVEVFDSHGELTPAGIKAMIKLKAILSSMKYLEVIDNWYEDELDKILNEE